MSSCLLRFFALACLASCCLASSCLPCLSLLRSSCLPCCYITSLLHFFALALSCAVLPGGSCSIIIMMAHHLPAIFLMHVLTTFPSPSLITLLLGTHYFRLCSIAISCSTSTGITPWTSVEESTYRYKKHHHTPR